MIKATQIWAGLTQQDRAGMFLCPVDVANLLWKLPRGKSAPNQLRRDSGDEVERPSHVAIPSPVSAAPVFFSSLWLTPSFFFWRKHFFCTTDFLVLINIRWEEVWATKNETLNPVVCSGLYDLRLIDSPPTPRMACQAEEAQSEERPGIRQQSRAAAGF